MQKDYDIILNREKATKALKDPTMTRQEIIEMRQKLTALHIDKRTERRCLKCGTRDHGASPCPKKICPVCNIADNHKNPLDCPYLMCNICGDKHLVYSCKLRPTRRKTISLFT